MASSRLRASKRALETLAALSAVALVVSGTSMARALRASADDTSKPAASSLDADLVQRCGAAVFLLLDASPVDGSPVDGSPADGSPVDGSPADATGAPLRTAVDASARSAALALTGTGSRLAALAYDSQARWLTDPAAPLPVVDDAALAAAAPDGTTQAGPLAAALAGYLTPPAVTVSNPPATTPAPDPAVVNGTATSPAAPSTTAAPSTSAAPSTTAGATSSAPAASTHDTADGSSAPVIADTAVAADAAITPAGTATAAPPAATVDTGANSDVAASAVPATGAHNWEAALQALAPALAALPAGQPALVLHVTTGAPTTAEGATRAAEAAAALRARPATHLLAVAVGDAATLGSELVGVAGPDVVTVGDRALNVGTDDVVLVPDAAALPGVTAELAGGLCATDVTATVLDDGNGSNDTAGTETADTAGTETTPRPGTTVTLSTPPPAQVAPLTGPSLTPATGPVAATSDAQGRATWRVQPNGGHPFELQLSAPDLTGLPAALACTQTDGAPVTAAQQGGGFHLSGVEPGGAVSCQLHVSHPRLASLAVHDDVVLGAGSPCPAPGQGSPAAVGTMTDTVVHCLTVANEGGRPLDHVVVRSPGLDATGLGGPGWTIDQLAPGAQATRRVEAPLDGLLSTTVSATADDAGQAQQASLDVVVQARPAALSVTRALAGADDPTCDHPLDRPSVGEHVSWCLTVTNTGGTFLGDVSVTDLALSATPIILPGRLAPGTSTTASGAGALLADPDGVPVATATSVDRAGEPLGDPGAVTSALTEGPGLQAQAQVSATRVTPGASVTMSVAVTNTSDEPLDQVAVDTTTCGPVARPSARLGDNGDASLQAGETWLYACSAPIYAETLAVASVVTPTQSVQTPSTVVVPQYADVRVKISQKNDLRVGSQTTYELKVQNTGDLPADNVSVVYDLNPGMTAVSASWQTVVPGDRDAIVPPPDDVGPAVPCQANGTQVVCALGTMPAQVLLEHILVTVTVAVDASLAGQNVNTTAKVTTSSPEQRTSDNDDSKPGKVFAAAECQDSRDCGPPSTDTTDEVPAGPGDSVPNARPFDPVSGSLAHTGVDPMAALAWGLVLLAAGLTLVTAGRRRYVLGCRPNVS